jgi:SNF2 family DNA or RNA helicase
MKLYKHQEKTVKKTLKNKSIFNTSDPGVGKTIAHLKAYSERKGRKKCLVLAPLSILESAWVDDCKKATPELKTSIALAKNRSQAFANAADIYITNHDAVKWILQQCKATKGQFLKDFDELIVDEITAFKRGTSQRTKALIAIRHFFEYRRGLTGTPATQSLLDMWSMLFILDDGDRLGDSFFKYRSNVAIGKQVGAHIHAIKWEDKPGAREIIANQLADINIRYSKEECLSLPEHNTFTVQTTLGPRIMSAYKKMQKDSLLALQNGEVNAVNAAVRANKLLQICTGAIYHEDKSKTILHTERYEQVLELVKARPWPCVVAFNWRHEREALVELSKKDGLRYAVIDGTVSATKRPEIVSDFQEGSYDLLIVHPQSAGHGLTLTQGRTTIWSSPTPNAEHFLQLNARIYRAGQTHKTETILLAARNTREPVIYDMLQGKIDRVTNILDLLTTTQEGL